MKRANEDQILKSVYCEHRQTDTIHHKIGVNRTRWMESQIDTVSFPDFTSKSMPKSDRFSSRKNGQNTELSGRLPNQALSKYLSWLGRLVTAADGGGTVKYNKMQRKTEIRKLSAGDINLISLNRIGREK